LATVIASPLADKLSLRITQEARMQSLYIDALGAIQEGVNPRIIEQMLSSYLSPKERDKASEEAAAAEQEKFRSSWNSCAKCWNRRSMTDASP